MEYRGYIITFDPPPIPIRTMDWHYVHEQYDGAEDAYDHRHGDCASLEACKHEIDDRIADEALASLDAAIAECAKPLPRHA